MTQENLHEKPRLVISSYDAGEPMAYQCSLCGQTFILPEDRTPKEGMTELWATFKEHVQERHPLPDDEAKTPGA
jgi:hypothetical protein